MILPAIPHQGFNTPARQHPGTVAPFILFSIKVVVIADVIEEG
jgi:hypothetical protein